MKVSLSRRHLSAAFACSAAFGIPVSHAQTTTERIVVVDWTIAETLLALGTIPVGVCELKGYQEWVAAPAVPSSVQDLGLRTEPNLELIYRLRPTLILVAAQFIGQYTVLQKIAPVQVLSFYGTATHPLSNASTLTLRMAERLGRLAQAQDLLQRADAQFSLLRDASTHLEGKSLLLAQFVDDRHIRVFGRNSLFGGVLDRAGLSNAWPETGSPWGFDVVTVDRLASRAIDHCFHIGPVPLVASMRLPKNPFWNALAFVKGHRFSTLPPVWAFGGIPAALRFAQLVHGWQKESRA